MRLRRIWSPESLVRMRLAIGFLPSTTVAGCRLSVRGVAPGPRLARLFGERNPRTWPRFLCVAVAAGTAFGFFAFKVAFSFPHNLTGGTGGWDEIRVLEHVRNTTHRMRNRSPQRWLGCAATMVSVNGKSAGRLGFDGCYPASAFVDWCRPSQTGERNWSTHRQSAAPFGNWLVKRFGRRERTGRARTGLCARLATQTKKDRRNRPTVLSLWCARLLL